MTNLEDLALNAPVPGSGGGIGSSQLVYRYTVAGSDKASIDTGADTPDAGDNVWSGGDLLEVYFSIRTDDAGATANVDITLNNDGSSIYDNQTIEGDGGTPASGNALAAATWQLPVHGDGGTSGQTGTITLSIPNYAGTTFNKQGAGLIGRNDATSGNNQAGTRALGYRSTSAITRLKVAGVSTAKLKVGSQLLIYKRLSA